MFLLLRYPLKEFFLVGSKSQLNGCIGSSYQLTLIHQSRCFASAGPAPVKLMGLGKASSRRGKRNDNQRKGKVKALTRADMLDINSADWSSVYDAASSYNPNVIPLEIRMGRPRHNRLGDVPPTDKGNVELLKIPNFFHLTPPAIKKHCEMLKEYCSPWPKDIGFRPIRITSINYLYSGPSIRHPESRKVKFQVYVKDLELDDHARRKFILLVGDRYNPGNDEVTLIIDRCPTRKQNKEYAYYLLTALYHESKKVEDWEAEAIGKNEKDVNKEVEKVRTELNPNYYEEKKRHRRHYRVINDKLIRFNRHGHPFLYELKKYGIKGGLTEEEKRLAKEEWERIQKDLPDISTFDPVFQRSSASEFSIV